MAAGLCAGHQTVIYKLRVALNFIDDFFFSCWQNFQFRLSVWWQKLTFPTSTQNNAGRVWCCLVTTWRVASLAKSGWGDTCTSRFGLNWCVNTEVHRHQHLAVSELSSADVCLDFLASKRQFHQKHATSSVFCNFLAVCKTHIRPCIGVWKREQAWSSYLTWTTFFRRCYLRETSDSYLPQTIHAPH